ncbi:TapB family protein [Chryseobacterium paridis]|uniref:DUF3108 domain-containing protein n=1 Tax=Chryseobacterium paridis TaxID=2800328 RepID=A0ABS1FV00_9FLAO|nr:hypothetical protein [Chryseobacterium paridis]MBK1896271.1 hypothetical protein [Chryseobacterium paridis]
MRTFLILLMLIMNGGENFFAQNCSDFYYFRKNTRVTFVQYDSGGNRVGKETGTLDNISIGKDMAMSDNAFILQSTKSKIADEFPSRILCINNNLKINYYISDLPGLDIYLSYPSNMKVGQNLGEDIRKSFNIGINDRKTLIHFNITSRKVIGQEIVKTSVGEFKSDKIQYDLSIEYNIDNILIPSTIRVVEWFSQNYGVVKKEFYTKDGILKTSSVLFSMD